MLHFKKTTSSKLKPFHVRRNSNSLPLSAVERDFGSSFGFLFRGKAIKRICKSITGTITSFALLASQVSYSYAQAIIIDPSAPSSTLLQPITTDNPVPVVDIATPESGVSLNTFTEFNVGENGLILNNSASGGLTQLGQNITGNGNLVSGPANVIVNEITGMSQSSLRGTTEVFGSEASVIIANPNGITCDGCAFLNTANSVLTTGTPQITGSEITLNADRGQITIGRGGFKADGNGALIARNIVGAGALEAGDGTGDLVISGGAQSVQIY